MGPKTLFNATYRNSLQDWRDSTQTATSPFRQILRFAATTASGSLRPAAAPQRRSAASRICPRDEGDRRARPKADRQEMPSLSVLPRSIGAAYRDHHSLNNWELTGGTKCNSDDYT
jgi:hypothetical protein